MAFVFKAERKIELAHQETAKNKNLGPGAYNAQQVQNKAAKNFLSK